MELVLIKMNCFFFSKIGVHNGWQFVRPPHTVYLEREYSDVPASTTPRKPTNRPPSGMSTLTR